MILLIKRALAAAFLVIFTAFTINGQSNPAVDAFTRSKGFEGASIGLAVTDLQTGKNLVSYNPDLLLAPASTAKLISSGVALQLLGPDFHFETLMGYSGTIDKSKGILAGNLIIRGGGDPTLGSEWFEQELPANSVLPGLAQKVKSAGITTVAGDLVVDISGFQKWTLPASWSWNDVGNYYGAGPSAINLYDNSVKLFFNSPQQAGKPTEIVSTLPEMEEVEWTNEVKSSEINRDMAYVFGSPWDDKRITRGTIPARRTNFVVKASMPNPPLVFGNLLEKELRSQGVVVKGKVRISEQNEKMEVIHRLFSPPLAKVCSVFNHESVNLIGEALVMQLAYQKNGFGKHEDGMEILSAEMKKATKNTTFFLEDGSGLSRFTAISAKQMNDFLQFMHKGKNGTVYRETLPVAGTGTLRSFNRTAFPGNTLQCKSGSMARVRSYAGYLRCQSGREVAFTIIANNFSGTQQEVFRAIEDFLLQVRTKY